MSPTIGKQLHHLTNSGSNFNNNITTSFQQQQQQHRSNYSTSPEFLSESSPDDSLGDFEGIN
jgi:protein required for attachment to host cells